MPASGCEACTPYAFDFQVVRGRSYCRACGREIADATELLIVGDPNLRPPRRPNNSFEKGIRRDERGLPYLDKNGQPLRMKEPFDPRDYGESPILIGGK